MKRKVQAQRKFAQGAYVPPLHTNNSLERRVDLVGKDEQRNTTTIHNMSANMLLDVVSFSNLHVHNKKLEPIVRLERLKKFQDPPAPQPTENTEPRRSPRAPKRLLVPKSKFPVRNLRKKRSKLKEIKRVQPRRPLRKRILDTQDNDEDNTPLKFFAKASKVEKNKEESPGGKRQKTETTTANSKPQSPSKSSPLKLALREPKQIDNKPRTRRSLEILKSSKVTSTTSKLKVYATRKRPIKPPERKKPDVRVPGKVKTSVKTKSTTNVTNNEIQTKLSAEWEKFPQLVTDIREDPVSSSKTPIHAESKVNGKATELLSDTKKKVVNESYPNKNNTKQKPSTNVEPQFSLLEEPATAESFPDRPQTAYYGANEIQRWIYNSIQNRQEEEDAGFKVPALPEASIYSGDVDGTKTPPLFYSATPSVCPSERYSTVKAVVSALSQDLERRCKNCSSCARVNKVEQLSHLVQRQRPVATAPGNDDIYEFDANDDDAVERPRLNHFRQNRNAARQRDPSAILSVTEGDDNYLYLDLLPEKSTHIIQIMSTKIPNQNKQMLRARLMPKSLANSRNEFSLIEHENLLDQLLETLNMSIHSKNKMTASRDQPVANTPINNEGSSVSIPPLSIAPTPVLPSPPVSVTRAPLLPLAPSVLISPSVPLAPSVSLTPSVPLPLSVPLASTVPVTPTVALTFSDLPAPSTSASTKSTLKSSTKNSSREKNSTSRPSTSKMATRGTPLASNRNTKTTVVDKEPLKKGRDRESTATTSKRAKSNTQKETQSGILMDAPIYYPTEEEFTDPLAYFTKIMPAASKHGLCKVVAPKGFKPTCTLKNEIRFNVSNQYIARLYSRWGPAAMEMCAIKTYLASQSVLFNRAPLLDSLEVNLPKLYHVVQRHGGLKNVMEKKRWGRVADELRIGRGCNPEKLDLLYLRYLLPYDTLSHNERQQMMGSVEKGWKRKNRKMLERASNPLHRQKRLLGETESSGEDTEEDSDMAAALAEAEDCVVPGRNMTLATFTKAAAAAQESYYGRANSPRPAGVEEEYWRLVLLGADHVCVYTASIDTGDEGYGFPTDKNDPYGTHPWNLKMISQNEGNVLRSLGPVLGVTVPTLHLGMMFSTSCWHRDPHGLPWMEYMHRGPHKIWYGIPDEQSSNFRKAVESLCPTSCQNKSIWLPSDITMIPPHLLREHNVTLSRVEQAPGEYVIVFPKAYSCSISTGYTQSESVYFATNTWLNGVDQVFQELRESCEPTMFSLEQLLLAIASDSRSSARVLRLISSSLGRIVADELDRRRQLARLGLTSASADSTSSSRRKRPVGAWNIREQDECEICRATLYLSKVTGVTGKKSAVCLQHALRLLDTQRKGETRANLVCFYSEDELSEVICALKTRLDDNR